VTSEKFLPLLLRDPTFFVVPELFGQLLGYLSAFGRYLAVLFRHYKCSDWKRIFFVQQNKK
jgi:hypothetical protein